MAGKIYFAIGVLITFLVVCANSVEAQNWTPTFTEEFFGSANGAVNSLNWTYDIGGNGWGNNELETYTNRTENAYLDGQGNLVIKVIKETFTGTDGITRNY